APSSQAQAGQELAQSRPDRCFRTDTIRNFRVDNRDQLYVRALDNTVYEINTSGGCWNMNDAVAIGIIPVNGAAGSSNVCAGDSVLVVVPGAAPGQGGCRAQIARALSAEDVAALPRNARP
ncbi:hypothetical protein LTR94_026484, partial [Friedmanniomyces endolithicus]